MKSQYKEMDGIDYTKIDRMKTDKIRDIVNLVGSNIDPNSTRKAIGSSILYLTGFSYMFDQIRDALFTKIACL
jgi:hypothetical protein